MADLEQRVTSPEREMSALRARVDAQEEDIRGVPDLIRAEFLLSNSQMARLSSEVERLRGEVGKLSGDVSELRELPAKADALPRVVAELVTEMLVERDRKR